MYIIPGKHDNSRSHACLQRKKWHKYISNLCIFALHAIINFSTYETQI